jgi:beta-lactamase regulating signal transducer with metallopeptidase domain/HEAT repeat protein
MTIVESVGWVLVHFVWQGIAIALALAAVLSLTSAAQSALRYALSCAALLMMLGAVIATTASVVSRDRDPLPTLTRTTTPIEAPVAEPAAAAARDRQARPGDARGSGRGPSRTDDVSASAIAALRPIVAAAMPWLVIAWAVGVLLLSIRLVGGWWRTRRLRVDGVGPVPDWCHARLAALAERLRIRRPVAILSSVRVRVPIVLGHLTPVIVVPASVLAGLSVAQLEAIIAHELAHVRRHDYLVNLAQTVIETLLFYHPAVWWVSRQIRDAREHCCDDLAVSVCSSRQAYVHALLGLEELKKPGDLLALGATDGPLLARARRLLLPPDRGAAAPRLAASVIALTVVAAAVTGAAFAADEGETPGTAIAKPIAASPANAATSRTGAAADAAEPAQDVPASSVVTAPDAAGPLAARWAWAERAARDARTPRYWIGYTISPVQTLSPVVYMDRSARILGDNISLNGTFFSSNAGGFRFPGRRLAVQGGDRLVKVLLAFDARRGAPVLSGVHASSLALPVDTKDFPIYWLGSADAAGSQAQIDRLYKGAGTVYQQNDLIAVMGMHDASAAVVAWLEGRVASGDPDDLRAEATEWIARHPIPRSIAALDRVARGDRVSRVRQEAAEALGDLALPDAAPVLIALARELEDRDARQEAVEALGARSEPSARDALESIARQDPSLDIQREAVESLGDLSGGRGLPTLIDLVRTHPDVEVRREAIETIGDAEPTDEIVNLLKQLARADGDPRLQEEAVDTLAGLDRADTLATLIDLARTHPRSSTRRQAVEALADRAADRHDGQPADRATVLDVLSKLAASDPDIEVQVEAAETLGGIPGPEAIARLRDLIGTKADERVRAEAVESLGDHGPAADVAPILKSIAINDPSPRVADEAIETLADLEDGAGVAALAEIVREQPDTRIWRRALEALLDSDAPAARDLFKQLKASGRKQ